MTAHKFFKRLGGFTLVELLIVIAILAIIALIVIAAINPIEQANRAKDTGMKADGSQLVSAIDRYFTARFKFPWYAQDPTNYPSNEVAFGFVTAQDWRIGLCADDSSGGNDCATDGALITTEELKTEFRNRSFITTPSAAAPIQDALFLGKLGGDAAATVYACYVPMSKANRTRACADGLVFTLGNGTDGTRTPYNCSVDEPDAWIGTGPSDSYFVCVPQ